MAPADDVDEQMLLAELDFGNDPPGMLVIRESKGIRVAGIVVSGVLAAPFVLVSLLARGRGAPPLFIPLACAALPLWVALFLAWQLLQANSFYVALDDHWLRRRRGSRRLLKVPLKELGPFEKRGGALGAYRRLDSGRKRWTTLLKDAYAPESLAALADRLNAWRTAPRAERAMRMAELDWRAIARRKRLGNRLIWAGLASCLLLAILIVAAMQLRNPAWRGIRVLLAGFGVFVAFGQVLAGIAIRLSAANRHRRLRRAAEP